MLLVSGADVNIKTKAQAKTPLHYAAQEGNTPIAEILIRYGADVNNSSGLLPITPLDYAKSFGHTQTIRLLESHGAVGYGFLE